MMEYYSPLRYPGGKGKITSFFKDLIRDNSIYDCIYIEPYAGGASVALSLLFNEYASRIIINDLDSSIYSFWYSVVNNTDSLCRLINDTPISIENWEKQKYIQNNKNLFDILSIGFSTFFLNRTNRSGIINAGFIGGHKQTGKWKIDARFNKKELISRINKIAKYKNRITIYNLDAVHLLIKIKNGLSTKSLIYLDPPYYRKGKDLYLNYYVDSDHIQISKIIKKFENYKWVITYDNVGFIRDLYSNFRLIKYTINYSASTSSKGEELLVLSDNLSLKSKSALSCANFISA